MDYLPPRAASCLRCQKEVPSPSGWKFGKRGLCANCLLVVIPVVQAFSGVLALVVALVVAIAQFSWHRESVADSKLPASSQTQSAAVPQPTFVGVHSPTSTSSQQSPLERSERGEYVENHRSDNVNGTDGGSEDVPLRTRDDHEQQDQGALRDSQVQTPKVQDTQVQTPLVQTHQDQPTITISIDVTPAPIERHAQPLHELALPRAPNAFRSYLTGRCSVFSVSVSESGQPDVHVLDTAGVPPLFVRLAIHEVSVPWRPAMTKSGEITAETVIVKFCW